MVRNGQRRSNTNIDHLQFDPPGSRERVDGRAATKEIQNHLRRDRLRIGAHSFRAHPVIGSEEYDARMAGGQFETLVNGGAPGRDFFHAPEASRRLRQFQLTACGGLDPVRIDGANFR